MAPRQYQQNKPPEHAKRMVLEHYFHLQLSIQLLTNQAAHNELLGNIQTCDVTALDPDIKAIGEYLSSQFEAIYYNERHMPGSTTAFKVFQIPELLDMILDSTDFIDILHMSETCRSIRDIIYASKQLQVRLFLRAGGRQDDMQLAFQSSLLRCNKVQRYHIDDYSVMFDIRRSYLNSDARTQHELPLEDFVTIRFEKDDDGHGSAQINRSWTNMMLCQPTIKTMQVIPESDCFVCQKMNSKIFRSKTGFTLGNLLAQAKEAFERGCLWCRLTEDQLNDCGQYETSFKEVPDTPVQSVLIKAFLQ